ncbi:MAG: [LysW]-aminoadipate kinase, partial [Candidatus Marinimicrobia bacterium]|nr:[LysW]-aminoadipate kinase [Candidatus Neomarinimicrobiota bacterium]
MDLVLKIGGADGMDYEAIADDIKWFCNGGGKMVLVHGGSAATNQVAAALGHPARFVTTASGHTSRRTDRRTMEIFQMVYCGQMNKGWVERLQKRGLPALGLSGMDGRLWEGRRKRTLKVVENGRRRVLRDDYTGRVERVNRDLLQAILKMGYLPVLTPPAISYEGEAINVDGDRAAASTAVALAARQMVIGTVDMSAFVNLDASKVRYDEIEQAMVDQCRASSREIYGVHIETIGIRRISLPERATEKVFDNISAQRATIASMSFEEGKAAAQAIEASPNANAAK